MASAEELLPLEKEHVEEGVHQGPGACAACYKRPASNDPGLLFCSRCKAVGREVTYCSSKCQLWDWKSNEPPHKEFCGKLLRSTGFDHLEPTSFPLFTTTPSPKLSLQLSHLHREHTKWDYTFTGREDGLPWQKEFGGEYKRLFLEARENALAERDLASVGVMEAVLKISAGDVDKPELWSRQLEEEFGVTMDECRKKARERGGEGWDFLEGVTKIVERNRAAHTASLSS